MRSWFCCSPHVQAVAAFATSCTYNCLYVTDRGTWKQFGPPFTSSSKPLIVRSYISPHGIASNGTYLAVSSTSSKRIAIYKQNVTNTTGANFAVTAAGIPRFIAFDRQGGLWVPTPNEVQKFQSPLSSTSTAGVTIPVSNPGAVAADAYRNVYVTQIQVYGSGNTPPRSALLRYTPPYTGKPIATLFGWQLNGVAIYGNKIVVTAYLPVSCECVSLFYSTLPLTSSSKWTPMNTDGQAFAPAFDSSGHLYVNGGPSFAMDSGNFNNGVGNGPAQAAIGP
jgi:hypothetical protein